MLGHAEMVMRSLDPKKDSVVIANMGRALPTLAQFATDSDNVGELTREFEEALNQLDYRNFWDIRKNNHFTQNGLKEAWHTRLKADRIVYGLSFMLHDHMDIIKALPSKRNDDFLDEFLDSQGKITEKAQKAGLILDYLGIKYDYLFHTVKDEVYQYGIFIPDAAILGKSDNLLRFVAFLHYEGYIDLQRSDGRDFFALREQRLLDLVYQAREIVPQIAEELADFRQPSDEVKFSPFELAAAVC